MRGIQPMKKLTITYVTFENGERRERTVTEIVASTKSQNNLLEQYSLDEKFVKGKPVEKELFVDAEKTAQALLGAFAGIGDNATVTALVNHAMRALDGACMFERPAKSK